MAEGKKGFVLYVDLIHTVNKLPDNKAGLLLKHILSYVNDEDPETDDIIVSIAFEPIKQQLKRDLKKWEEIRVKRSDAGKASAEARKQKQQVLTSVESVEQTPTKSTVKDNVIVKVNVKDNVINIPTLEDFKNYALENYKDVNTESVELKYKAWVENDWKDGNNKEIKNWKTKLLNTLTYLPKKISTNKSHIQHDTDF